MSPNIDLLDRPTVPAGSDHYFPTCFRLYIRTSVPTFQNIAKQNNLREKIMIAASGTVGLAEWIIDDACLVVHILSIWHIPSLQHKMSSALSNKLIYSANPQLRPIVVIIVFTHVVRSYVRVRPHFSKSGKTKQTSLVARLWVWPSGSPVLCLRFCPKLLKL